MKKKMDAELKQLLLSRSEEHLMLAIDDVYALAKLYVDSTETSVDDMALKFLEGLKKNLKGMVDKLDGEKDV